MIGKNNPEDILNAIKSLDVSSIDASLLKNFLKDYLTSNPNVLAGTKQTELKRAISILDWLTYGIPYHAKKEMPS